ncbi:uncharacterized protein ARMOST_03175 [Armillaria ostoyae]|uniref:Uncharacterized protein n=1 Tax=Armillaria ostoyae TaxID=47428 RepID=A0A284QTP6_ARMOS|nr:uncharacterized protein ARMOST_03175 [Armillaria ostoyae]
MTTNSVLTYLRRLCEQYLAGRQGGSMEEIDKAVSTFEDLLGKAQSDLDAMYRDGGINAAFWEGEDCVNRIRLALQALQDLSCNAMLGQPALYFNMTLFLFLLGVLRLPPSPHHDANMSRIWTTHSALSEAPKSCIRDATCPYPWGLSSAQILEVRHSGVAYRQAHQDNLSNPRSLKQWEERFYFHWELNWHYPHFKDDNKRARITRISTQTGANMGQYTVQPLPFT